MWPQVQKDLSRKAAKAQRTSKNAAALCVFAPWREKSSQQEQR